VRNSPSRRRLRLSHLPLILLAVVVLTSQVSWLKASPVSAASQAVSHASSWRASEVQGSAAPAITKMDPPNWWVGFTPHVMILAAGENLGGATVTCDRDGVRLTQSKVTAGGKYLFMWLEIAPDARAGDATIQIATPSGKTSVNFSLLARKPSQGKFQGFSPDDAIYLIMPDRFADGDPSNDPPPAAPGTYDRSKARAYHGGDFRGIRDHLDYLRDLGVTAIWLTPIVDNDNSSPQDYHGYGAVDEYAVEEHFGTQKDLQDLAAAARAKGIKMIFDFVPNHIGPKHPWVAAPPEPDWFHGTQEHHLIASGDFQFLTDPHAPPKYWRSVVEGWFANVLPDMNQENPDVAEYFIENALWWAEETGIDGYRLDTFPYVSRQFWSEWHRALRQVYPCMTTVGEVMNGDPVITSFFAGDRAQNDGIDSGVTAVFDYPFYYALREGLIENNSAARIVGVLAEDHLYPHPDLLVTFAGNHDVSRLASEKGASLDKIKLAFSIVLTMRGTPELYYGDEIGMTGGNDPDNRRDFPGGFPGDKQNAFTQSGRTPEQQDIFSHVQKLLSLRKEHPALRHGQLWHISWDESSYAFARTTSEERLLVVFNSGATPKTLRLPFAGTPLQGAQKLTPLLGKGGEVETKNDSADLMLAPNQPEIFSVQ
jgi:neopullulanase